jgi:hypothetical protein
MEKICCFRVYSLAEIELKYIDTKMYKTLVNKIHITTLLVFFALAVQAQEIPDSLFLNKVVFNQWTKVFNSEQVEIWAKKVDCIDKVNDIDIRKIFYKIVNKSNYFLAVEWDQGLAYNQKYLLSSDKKPEYRMRFALKPNETLEADCSTSKNSLTTFAKMLKPEHPMELISLRLVNVNVFK